MSFESLGTSDPSLPQIRLLKLENTRLVELLNTYQSTILELESQLHETSNLLNLKDLDSILAKERRKGTDLPVKVDDNVNSKTK